MPLRRYFLYIGSVLLALLFIADWYLPAPGAERDRSDVDRSVIRIHSVHKWPKAVVIDTTLPTIVPPAAKTMAATAPPPPPQPPREALLAEATPEAKPAEAVKPAKPRVRHTRVARAPGSRVASYDAFGFRNDFFAPRPTWPANW
jgi:hypothetical protein